MFYIIEFRVRRVGFKCKFWYFLVEWFGKVIILNFSSFFYEKGIIFILYGYFKD